MRVTGFEICVKTSPVTFPFFHYVIQGILLSCSNASQILVEVFQGSKILFLFKPIDSTIIKIRELAMKDMIAC